VRRPPRHGPKLDVLLALVLERAVDLVLGDLDLAAPAGEAIDLGELDLAAHLDAGGELEPDLRLERHVLDDRVGHRLELVLDRGLDERLAQHLRRDPPLDPQSYTSL